MRLTRVLLNYNKITKNYSNFPERYIKKQTEFVEWKTPRLPQMQRRVIRWRTKPYYDMHRSWTEEFQQQNAPNVRIPEIYVEPIRDFYIFRGDRVEILRGRDKGKHGIVNYVVTERNWVCVEGLNCEQEVRRRTHDYPGVAVLNEMPLLVPRDVALVDPSDQRATGIEWKFDDEGNKVRVSTRTGRIIPFPSVASETIDFKNPLAYLEQPKDTVAKEVTKSTFVPKVATFEMDIMEEMKIEEKRVPYQMFWY